MKDDTKTQKGQNMNRDFSKPRGIGSQKELDTDIGDQADVVDQNEGEGSRTAGRRYNESTEQYARSGKVAPKAREAEQALDSDEGEELRDAEWKGKQGPDFGSQR